MRKAENLMFRETLEILRKEHERLEEELKRLSWQVGESFETGGGWHDNPDWLNVLQRQKACMQNLRKVRASLSTPVFIDELPARTETLPTLRVGMCAKVLDLDSARIDSYGIVGTADMVFNPRYRESEEGKIHFASVSSPLAQQLLGKSMAQTVTLRLPEGIQNLMIMDVYPITRETEEP